MKNDSEFMEHLLAVVRENLANENFDVRALVRATRYSRTQTYRRIKSLTGFPPSVFIAEQRLLQARDLLAKVSEHRMSVAQIAYATGFKDPAWFGRAFKKRFGMTPGEAKGSS